MSQAERRIGIVRLALTFIFAQSLDGDGHRVHLSTGFTF
jgi:hypothetical protein